MTITEDIFLEIVVSGALLPPEPLKEEQRVESAELITLLGEEPVQFFASKAWQHRETAIKLVENLIADSTDLPQGFILLSTITLPIEKAGEHSLGAILPAKIDASRPRHPSLNQSNTCVCVLQMKVLKGIMQFLLKGMADKIVQVFHRACICFKALLSELPSRGFFGAI